MTRSHILNSNYFLSEIQTLLIVKTRKVGVKCEVWSCQSNPLHVQKPILTRRTPPSPRPKTKAFSALAKQSSPINIYNPTRRRPGEVARARQETVRQRRARWRTATTSTSPPSAAAAASWVPPIASLPLPSHLEFASHVLFGESTSRGVVSLGFRLAAFGFAAIGLSAAGLFCWCFARSCGVWFPWASRHALRVSSGGTSTAAAMRKFCDLRGCLMNVS